MRLLVAGGCGFVGSTLVRELLERREALEIVALDNLSRPGSAQNVGWLRRLGVTVVHGDVRSSEDLEQLPTTDWVIDAAANPSVLAGVDGRATSRQTMRHNVGGTLELLEYCRRHGAGLIMLSSSRVYSVPELAALPVVVSNDAYIVDRESEDGTWGAAGIRESFSTAPPLSLYGASKLASEIIAAEYGATFEFPVWINRCGVLAGAGQFGRPDQGIFAFWINGFLRGYPLRYIGFGGSGFQSRDCLHPRDMVALLLRQMEATGRHRVRTFNVGGGAANAMSLLQLSRWCADRFGVRREIAADLTPRTFDVPWVVMDNGRARETWDWRPSTSIEQILEEIAIHAASHPEWLEISGVT